MPPSSLIFVVIIAIWAAYVVQYWIRRREHLATARSVDEFSETMRVLARRGMLPRTDLSAPAPRSYAVTPTPAARPQILVKRAEAMTMSTTPTPATAPRGTARPDDGGSTPRPVASRPASRATARPSRKVRGVLLLTALALVPVTVVLAVLAIGSWWFVAAAVGASTSAFLWLRMAVQAQLRARRETARPARGAAGRSRQAAPATTRPPMPSSGPQTAQGVSDTRIARQGAEPGEVETTTQVARAPYDVDASSTCEAAVASAPAEQTAPAESGSAMVGSEAADPTPVPLVDEDDIPLTWDPRPVPRPTYTMKAKASRPTAPTTGESGDCAEAGSTTDVTDPAGAGLESSEAAEALASERMRRVSGA